MTTSIVYIDSGCIYCQACTTTAPEVFILPDDQAMIKGEVRIDGITSQNINERSPLIADVDWDLIQEAAEGCPIEIIKIVQ